jgi:hypothetical protein
MWDKDCPNVTLWQSVERLKQNGIIFHELIDLLDYLYEKTDTVTCSPQLPFETPLELHANYSAEEILVALGRCSLEKPPYVPQGGVMYLPEIKTDYFMITLNKSEKHYSPTTMYLDYAISDELFHWQSQNSTSPESTTGKRYLNGESTVLLFVRENKSIDGISSSYCFLGPAKYVSHSGSRPINITWQLLYKMPARLCRMTERMAIA